MVQTSILAEIPGWFAQQQKQAPLQAQTTLAQRKAMLRAFELYLQDSDKMAGLYAAMAADMRKPAAEVLISEILIVLQHLRHTRRHLRDWMRDQPVPGGLLLAGTRSKIRYEPKGVALIIAPWNYPFMLAMSPLVYCLAAGNTAIVKPSELSPHTSAFMQRLISDLFPPEVVRVVEGDVAVASALLELPFDHIFFTGSPAVGKIVMAAAAKHLTSVTLELGGKSPVLIDATANLAHLAPALTWGKLLNNGQSCIAPDYALVEAAQVPAVVAALRQALATMYPEGPATTPDYGRIINDRHYQRLRALYEDALAQGAEEVIGGEWDPAQRFVPPTVLTGVTTAMAIMQEEIFGPILPIMAIPDLEAGLAWVRAQPKPLALYVGSRSRTNIATITARTSSGGMVINDFMLGYGNPNLPFGGVNNSGLGKYMGFYGFVAFSNEKAVIERRWANSGPLYPPFTAQKLQLYAFIKRWLV